METVDLDTPEERDWVAEMMTITGAGAGFFAIRIVGTSGIVTCTDFHYTTKPPKLHRDVLTRKSHSIFADIIDETVKSGKLKVCYWDVFTQSPGHQSIPSDHLSIQSLLCLPIPSRFQIIHGLVVLANANGYWKPYIPTLIKTANDYGNALDIKHPDVGSNRAKDTLIATLSHEIKTPLNGMVGVTGWLMRTPPEQRTEAKMQQRLRILNSCNLQLVTLINDVLDLTKLREGTMKIINEDFDIRKIIGEIMEHHITDAKNKNIELTHFISPDIPEVLIGDPYRITQILNNILSNAIKFTDQIIGEIDLRVAVIPCSTEDTLYTLRLEVRDNGPGIPVERVKQVFEPFEQLGDINSRTGTGLGLTIVQQLVTLMRGEISIEPVKPHGCCFVVQLPIREKKSIERLWKVYEEAIASKRILMVDDRVENRIFYTEFIDKFKIKGVVVGTAEEALHYVISAAPDNQFNACIIDMDLGTGSLTGAQLAQQIRAHSPFISLICFSSIGVQDFPVFDLFVEKPLENDKVIKALGKVIKEEPQQLMTPRPGRRLSIYKETSRILVVDDDSNNRETFRFLLEEMGYAEPNVVFAKSGEEALSILDTTFKVILMDLKMPKLSGIECARAIRQQHAVYGHPTIIAITASGLEVDRAAAIQVGMEYFLTKPVDALKLRQLLFLTLKNSSFVPNL